MIVENIAPKQVWEALISDPKARLVDVRTDVEWAQIGVPDLAQTGQPPVMISWQVAPTMQVNAGFVDDLHAAGLAPDDHIYFLCRSGVRSEAAAHTAEQAGSPTPTTSPAASKVRQTDAAHAATSPAGKPTDCPGPRADRCNR